MHVAGPGPVKTSEIAGGQLSVHTGYVNHCAVLFIKCYAINSRCTFVHNLRSLTTNSGWWSLQAWVPSWLVTFARLCRWHWNHYSNLSLQLSWGPCWHHNHWTESIYRFILFSTYSSMQAWKDICIIEYHLHRHLRTSHHPKLKLYPFSNTDLQPPALWFLRVLLGGAFGKWSWNS